MHGKQCLQIFFIECASAWIRLFHGLCIDAISEVKFVALIDLIQLFLFHLIFSYFTTSSNIVNSSKHNIYVSCLSRGWCCDQDSGRIVFPIFRQLTLLHVVVNLYLERDIILDQVTIVLVEDVLFAWRFSFLSSYMSSSQKTSLECLDQLPWKWFYMSNRPW